MSLTRRILYILAVLLVTAAALGLHLRAVRMLPIDYDEDDYLAVAQRYTRFMAAGDVQGIVDYAINYEHPPLTKLLYGVALLPLPRGALVPEQPNPNIPPARTLPQPDFRVARTVSAALGTAEVAALALLNPVGGLFLAVNTWQLKYTSQIMLEPLPALTSLLAVLCYFLAARAGSSGRRRTWWTWLALSAVFLGLTAASKYTYCVVGLAIIADILLALRDAQLSREAGSGAEVQANGPRAASPWRVIRYLVQWAVIAIVVFFIANPRMWSHPFERLLQSVLYHGAYSQSQHVKDAGFPMWQPLVWLLGPVPWHPGVFLVMIDTLIALLAAVGMPRLWRRYRVFALWFAIGFVFLLIWPTKWPQYILTITAPLSLGAALGLEVLVWKPLARLAHTLRGRPNTGQVVARAGARSVARRDTRRAMPWLIPGLIALAVLALFPLIYQAAMSLTDFNALAIRDGIHGGVWRAVWEGLSGHAKTATVGIFEGATRSKEVHWAGPQVLVDLLGGAAPDLLGFNLLWAALSVLMQAVLGVAAALMLNRPALRWRTFWRTVFILPWAVPEFVGALIWLRILEPDFGWLALARGAPADAMRGQAAPGPDAILIQLLVAATWYGFPFIMLAATAALKMTPVEVYDAAAIDGAGGWQQFRWITWPLLLPLLAPAVLIRSIFAFNQFYLFYTMRIGPPTVTLATASFYLLSPTGPFGGQFAVAAAVNIFVVLVLLGMVVVLSRWTRSEAAEETTYA